MRITLWSILLLKWKILWFCVNKCTFFFLPVIRYLYNNCSVQYVVFTCNFLYLSQCMHFYLFVWNSLQCKSCDHIEEIVLDDFSSFRIWKKVGKENLSHHSMTTWLMNISIKEYFLFKYELDRRKISWPCRNLMVAWSLR